MDPPIGFVTQLGMDRSEALRAAENYGFDYVELMMDGAGARPRLEDDASTLADAFDDHGLDCLVHLPFGGIDVGSPFEHVRAGSVAEIEANLDLAAALGATKAVLHPVSRAWSHAWDDDHLRGCVVESVRELDEYGDGRGVELCAENIPHGVMRTHDFPRLFSETDVSMTLDTGHARMDGRDSGGIASFASQYHDRISHFHLNDTRQTQDEHLPFGAGDIDFERIFRSLPDRWDGTLSLEVFTHDYDYIGKSKSRLDDVLARV